MKPAHRIGIPPGLRILYVERHEGNYDFIEMEDGVKHGSIFSLGHYRLWLHRSLSNALLGTYLALWDNGKIERVTVRADEGDQVNLIKPED